MALHKIAAVQTVKVISVLRVVVIFVFAMTVSVSNLTGKSHQSHAAEIRHQKTPVNIMIPDDVMTEFLSAPETVKEKHCSANNNHPYHEISFFSKNPPKRLFGYNSRMDNREKVEGAIQTDEFVLRMAEVYTDAWVSGSNEKKQKALDALYAWAEKDALTQTKPCAKNGRLLSSCSEWTQPDGQDPSDKKDHSTAQMHMMHLAYGYYLTLADFNSDDPKHEIIQSWINKFFKWNKKPGSVYIGLDLGWYWPGVLRGTLENAPNYSDWNPKKLLKTAVQALDKIVLEDGSIKNRTTRGNKALWYHHTGLIETIITLEMARKHDIRIPPSLGKRIEKAGEIFIKGFEDHSYMDKWAKVAHNSVFTPGKQDFKNNLNLPNGNSWLYIFSFRYPNLDLTNKLDKILAKYPKNGRMDGYIGFGLGCIYAAAKEVRQ